MNEAVHLDPSWFVWPGLPDDGPVILVVLGDSTSFTDHRGPQLPTEPGLYPNVAAAHLSTMLDREVTPTVLARPGWTVRDAQRATTKDRHVMFDVLARAHAVVIGVGSFDHAPGGIPPSVEAVVPYLRPATVRRRVRKALTAAYPWAVKATGHRFHRTAPTEFARLYDLLLTQVRGLTRGAPGVSLGPINHRARYYGDVHPRRDAAEARQFEIARAHGYATVGGREHVEAFEDDLNPDGIHWHAKGHEAVGIAIADALHPMLTGQAPAPGVPGAPH